MLLLEQTPPFNWLGANFLGHVLIWDSYVFSLGMLMVAVPEKPGANQRRPSRVCWWRPSRVEVAITANGKFCA